MKLNDNKNIGDFIQIENLRLEKEKIQNRHGIVRDKCDNFISSLKEDLEKINFQIRIAIQ